MKEEELKSLETDIDMLQSEIEGKKKELNELQQKRFRENSKMRIINMLKRIKNNEYLAIDVRHDEETRLFITGGKDILPVNIITGSKSTAFLTALKNLVIKYVGDEDETEGIDLYEENLKLEKENVKLRDDVKNNQHHLHMWESVRDQIWEFELLPWYKKMFFKFKI